MEAFLLHSPLNSAKIYKIVFVLSAFCFVLNPCLNFGVIYTRPRKKKQRKKDEWIIEWRITKIKSQKYIIIILTEKLMLFCLQRISEIASYYAHIITIKINAKRQHNSLKRDKSVSCSYAPIENEYSKWKRQRKMTDLYIYECWMLIRICMPFKLFKILVSAWLISTSNSQASHTLIIIISVVCCCAAPVRSSAWILAISVQWEWMRVQAHNHLASNQNI